MKMTGLVLFGIAGWIILAHLWPEMSESDRNVGKAILIGSLLAPVGSAVLAYLTLHRRR